MVQRIEQPDPIKSIEDLAAIFLIPTYEPVVLANFQDKSDAALYRLSL